MSMTLPEQVESIKELINTGYYEEANKALDDLKEEFSK